MAARDMGQIGDRSQMPHLQLTAHITNDSTKVQNPPRYGGAHSA